MAITQRTATAAELNSSTSVTGTRPTDRQTGDLVVVVFAMTCTAASVTGPGGSWVTLVAPTQATATLTVAAYYQFDPASDPTASTSGGAGQMTALCQAFAGVDTTTPVDVAAVTSSTSGATTLACTGVTTVTDGAMVLSGVAAGTTSRTLTISGLTEIIQYSHTSTGRAGGLAGGVQASAGATGSKTWGNTDSVSLAYVGFVTALRPAIKAFTGTVAQSFAATGDLTTGMSGSRPQSFAATGTLGLGVTLGGTRAQAFSATGNLDVVSRVFTGALEIEFTAGAWTDVTSRLAFSRGPLVVRQGRATKYDDVTAGTLSCALFDDDGALMPDNTGSPYWPNVVDGKRIRWRVTKSSVTYTRFIGWIQSWQPEFPTGSTTGSIVQVTATDALGLLAQRLLRSDFTELALVRARLDGAHVDAWEASGSAVSGITPMMTNYSGDAAKGTASTVYAATQPTLSFGPDSDVSIGGVGTAQRGATLQTVAGIQSGGLQLVMHFKLPGDASSGEQDLATFVDGSGTTLGDLTAGPPFANINIRNAAGTSLSLFASFAVGQWALVRAVSNAGNPALSDWSVILGSGASAGTTGVAFDLRNVRSIYLPGKSGGYGAFLGSSFGGVAMLGTRTALAYQDSFTGAAGRTVAARIAQLADVVSPVGVTISTLGTLTGDACTGKWSERSALDVLQEIVRTASGIAWARSRDSVVYAVGSDQLYPASPVATVDTDADCDGTPRLEAGTESRPTRVDVEWPGGVATVRDTTAEAGGQVRSKRIATVAAAASDAAAVGVDLFERMSTARLRISQVTVDLVTGETDHTAALFSESGTLGGLYPTQRVRLTVPASHFGSTTVDVHVAGWVESYSPSGVTVALDTTPTPSGVLLRDLSVTNGSTTIVSGTSVFTSGDVGKVITGAGIPDGTTIEAVTSGTQVTVSQPATQTGSGVWGVVSSKLIAVDWWGGADGAAWSSRWVAGSTATGGSTTCLGGQGRVAAGTVANIGTVRRLSGVTFTDGEIVCSVTCDQTGGFALIGYRTDTGDASTNLYFLMVKATGNPLTLGRSISSSVTYIGAWAPGTPLTVGVKYRVRIRAIGSNHKARIWQASQPEPSGWNINVTDATHTSGALALGGSNVATTGNVFRFDDYAVTKEG